MINAAKRPVLHSRRRDQCADTRARTGGKRNRRDDNDLNGAEIAAQGASATAVALGMLGMHGARSTNFILQEGRFTDCPGARLMTGDWQNGAVSFCPNAKIIHVDIDRAELGKIKQPHVAIQADVDDVLAQLSPISRHSRGKYGISWWRTCSKNSLCSIPVKITRLVTSWAGLTRSPPVWTTTRLLPLT